jgi:hypothetical protein
MLEISLELLKIRDTSIKYVASRDFEKKNMDENFL